MSTETEPPLQVEIAHVLFIDVVGYSKLLMDDQREHRRIMQALWRADSEAVLQALRTSPYRERRPLEFNTLFGYILGNRDGIDNWHLIPTSLRRSFGRKLAPVRSGSGVIEKNIEVRIGRRFKRQGRSWSRNGAEHLAQLLWLQMHPADWTHWWSKTPFKQNQSKPRLAFMRPTHQLTIDQHYPRNLALDLPLARATKEQYDRMIAEDLGELDKSGIAELTFKDRHKHAGNRA